MSQNSNDHPNLMRTKTDERIFMSHAARQNRRPYLPDLLNPCENSRRAKVLREVQEAFSALRATQFEELRRENSSFGKSPIDSID
jgi:hypothetical protein